MNQTDSNVIREQLGIPIIDPNEVHYSVLQTDVVIKDKESKRQISDGSVHGENSVNFIQQTDEDHDLRVDGIIEALDSGKAVVGGFYKPTEKNASHRSQETCLETQVLFYDLDKWDDNYFPRPESIDDLYVDYPKLREFMTIVKESTTDGNYRGVVVLQEPIQKDPNDPLLMNDIVKEIGRMLHDWFPFIDDKQFQTNRIGYGVDDDNKRSRINEHALFPTSFVDAARQRAVENRKKPVGKKGQQSGQVSESKSDRRMEALDELIKTDQIDVGLRFRTPMEEFTANVDKTLQLLVNAKLIESYWEKPDDSNVIYWRRPNATSRMSAIHYKDEQLVTVFSATLLDRLEDYGIESGSSQQMGFNFQNLATMVLYNSLFHRIDNEDRELLESELVNDGFGAVVEGHLIAERNELIDKFLNGDNLNEEPNEFSMVNKNRIDMVLNKHLGDDEPPRGSNRRSKPILGVRNSIEIAEETVKQIGEMDPSDPNNSIYCRSNGLVYVTESDDEEVRSETLTVKSTHMSIHDMNTDTLESQLKRYFRLVKHDTKTGELVEADTIQKTVKTDLLNTVKRGRIRKLKHIIEHPYYTRRFEFVNNGGWNATSQLLMNHSKIVEIKDMDLMTAWRNVDRLIDDFPFKSVSDKMNAAALLFTIAINSALPGGQRTPLFTVDANEAQSGKSTLCQILVAAATGSIAGSIPYDDDTKRSRQEIISHINSGAETCQLDNATEGVKIINSALAAILTDDKLRFRPLYANETKYVDNYLVYMITGNNMHLDDDLISRSCFIRLKALGSFEHRNYSHDDIINYTVGEYQTIYSSVYKIIQSWMDAGRKSGDLKHRARVWAKWMSGIFDHLHEQLGIVGTCRQAGEVEIFKQFMANRHEAQMEANKVEGCWFRFFEDVYDKVEGYSFSAREVVKEFESSGLAKYVTDDEVVTSVSVGRALTKRIINKPNANGFSIRLGQQRNNNDANTYILDKEVDVRNEERAAIMSEGQVDYYDSRTEDDVPL